MVPNLRSIIVNQNATRYLFSLSTGKQGDLEYSIHHVARRWVPGEVGCSIVRIHAREHAY